jgi:MFS family permease
MASKCTTCWSYLRVTVEPVLFIYCLSGSLALPTDFALTYRKACANLYSANVCSNLHNGSYPEEETATQTLTSHFSFYQNIVFTVPSVISGIVYGSWSDSFSRKYVLLIPLIGPILPTTNNLIHGYFLHTSLDFLLLSAILYGMTGGTTTFLMAFSIGDLSTFLSFEYDFSL